jgi:hypothetical protein
MARALVLGIDTRCSAQRHVTPRRSNARQHQPENSKLENSPVGSNQMDRALAHSSGAVASVTKHSCNPATRAMCRASEHERRHSSGHQYQWPHSGRLVQLHHTYCYDLAPNGWLRSLFYPDMCATEYIECFSRPSRLSLPKRTCRRRDARSRTLALLVESVNIMKLGETPRGGTPASGNTYSKAVQKKLPIRPSDG